MLIFVYQTGTSALFFAAQGGFLDIATLLLDAGAAIDAPSMVNIQIYIDLICNTVLLILSIQVRFNRNKVIY